MADDKGPLQAQAWNYFSTHAAQRISTFNFYIVLSTLTATTYFQGFKDDSKLAPVQPLLAFLLSLFAYIFWKLDQRNCHLVKNAEDALRSFEAEEGGDDIRKIFTRENLERSKRPHALRFLLHPLGTDLSYSHCFNFVFLVFFLGGLTGIARFVWHLFM